MSNEKFRNPPKEPQVNTLDTTTALLLDSFGNVELWIPPIKSNKESYLFIKLTNSSDAAMPFRMVYRRICPFVFKIRSIRPFT